MEREGQDAGITLNQRAVVVDAHHDILIDVYPRRRQGAKAVLSTRWAPRLRQAGVDVQVFPVYVDSVFLPEMALRRTLQLIEAFYADLEEDGSQIVLATSYADIEAALAGNKIAGILGLEGVEGLGNDLELLHTLYRLGVRVVSLTWNRRTAFADGTGEQGTGSRLTRLGFEAVREMNRLNILIDVSHAAERGFFDILETTRQTVIASHSNARGIYDHPRNLSDDQIRALAENGGVMGLLVHPGIIDPENPTLSRCVDHIAYVADLVGIEHVGIGCDLCEDYIGETAGMLAQEALVSQEFLQSVIQGCGRVEELPNLTGEMMRRGFSEDEIAQVLGQNFMRVLQKVLIWEKH
jgi:membrane dipeptidase